MLGGVIILYIITHTYPEENRKYNTYEIEYLIENYKGVKVLSFSDYQLDNSDYIYYIKRKPNIKLFKYLKLLSLSGLKEFIKSITSLNMALNIKDELSIKPTDILLGYWLTRPSMVAYYLSLLTGAKLYIQGHGSDVFLNLPAMFQQIYDRCRLCFVVGKRHIDHLTRHVGQIDKIVLAPLGVKELKVAKKKKRKGSSFTFISAGHLYKIKGFDLLLGALARLDNKKFKLLLIGSGPEEKRLKELAENKGISQNIEFVGWVEEEKLIELMYSADAYILSSYSEGVPIVLMQACSVGLPLICNNVGSVTDVAINGYNALLNEDITEESLAEVINKFIELPSNIRSKMGQNSYQIYKERFVLETNLKKKYDIILTDSQGDSYESTFI